MLVQRVAAAVVLQGPHHNRGNLRLRLLLLFLKEALDGVGFLHWKGGYWSFLKLGVYGGRYPRDGEIDFWILEKERGLCYLMKVDLSRGIAGE